MKKIYHKYKINPELAFFLVITACFLLTRFWHLMDTAGYHCDEAVIQYNIYTLSEYGTDRYNCPFPVYFQNRLSGQSSLYIYLSVLLVKLFGFSTFLCRIPQIAGGYLLLLFGYWYVKSALSPKAAYFYAVFITICPYFIMSERFALDCTLSLPCMVMGLYFERRHQETGKKRYLVCSGCTFGIMMYSYLITVLFLFIHFIRLFITRRRKEALAEAGISVLVGLPVLYFIGVLFHFVPEIHTFFTISNVSSSRMGDVSFHPVNLITMLQRLFLCDKSFNFDSFPGYGTLYYLSIPVCILGIWSSLKDRKTDMVWVLLELSVMYLFITDLSTYKVLLLFFPAAVFTAYGSQKLVEKTRLAGWLVPAAYLVLFLAFYNSYLETDSYLYFDQSLYDISGTISPEDSSYIDTSGTYLGDGYIMLGTLCDPEDIVYNGLGTAVRIRNLSIDGEIPYDKDQYYIRNYMNYSYEDNNPDEVMRQLATQLSVSGFRTEKKYQYYIFKNPG